MKKPTSSERMSWLRAEFVGVQLVAAAVLSGGCTSAPAPMPTDTSNAQQLSADSQYMVRMFGVTTSTPAHPNTVDLADPNQYRFVTNRLQAAGKTAQNSPYLFERLEATRQKAIARAKGGTSNLDPSATWCASFIHLGPEVNFGSITQFPNSRPFVSCLGGASYVYADLYTFQTDVTGSSYTVVASAYGEDYSGGTSFDAVTISPTLPAARGVVNFSDSFVIAQDSLGNQQVTYNSVQSNMTNVAGSIALAHPTWHMIPSTGGAIEMCQLRGGADQCDYAVGSLGGGGFLGWTPDPSGVFTGIAAVQTFSGTWVGDSSTYIPFPTSAPYNSSHVYLPTQGTLDVGANATGACMIRSIVSADFRLIKTGSGGACITSTSFAGSFTIIPNTRFATFKGISDFTNDGGMPAGVNCSLNPIINETVKPVISVTAMADCGDRNPDGTPMLVRRVAAVATDPTTGLPSNQPVLSQLVLFLNSCFAEGTRIRRADGSSTTVETIKAGDKVIADNKGTVLTVTDTSHGAEDEPLVVLHDDKGHELKATSKHPIIKASGDVVFASAIKKGDRVMTDRGIASITQITRLPYTGQVYNLKLGTDAEKAKVGKNGTTMFAGGFLVGDSAMQQDHDTPHHPVAQLSKEWARDYQNAVANNPPMKRVLR